MSALAAALPRERSRAGLSLSALAQHAGVAKSTLSQLEAGDGNPAMETVWALSLALGVPVSRLLEPARGEVRVVRADEEPVPPAEGADHAATLLAFCPPDARRDLYRLQERSGVARRSDPHPTGTVEHVIVSTGRALVGPPDAPVELHAGDYMCYPGDAPHVFDAQTTWVNAVMVLEYL